MKRTKRDEEGFNVVLSEYHLEMLDVIFSTLSIDPKSKDKDPLLKRLNLLRRKFVRPQKHGKGGAPQASKILIEAIITYGLIELSTALNEGTPVPTKTNYFTGDDTPDTDTSDFFPKPIVLADHYTTIIDEALARSRLNAVINATTPTSSDGQD